MDIEINFFTYSILALISAGILASVFASLRYTGDVGLPRLIERGGPRLKQLHSWQHRWDLLCKTVRLLLTLSAIATFVLFYLAFRNCAYLLQMAALFMLALIYMLIARIIPHVLSESYADRISLAALPLVGPITLLLFVFVWPMQRIEDRLMQHAMSSSDEDDRPSTEDEVISLLEDTDEGDMLEKEEREIIRSVFEFGDTVAREIMTPRIDISGIKDSMTVAECVDQVKESRHSRFPVYHENIDDIIGMIHVKDLLRLIMTSDKEKTISQLVKRIDFIPETMPLNDLLQLMKTSRSQMVLVVDEYGGTEGLVTMEDIIEELVGEIEDEYDLEEKEFHRRPDGSVMVKARMPICELNEALGTKLPESEEYDSLGGYIYAALGRIPKAGETLEAPGYTLRISSASQRQIQIIHMVPLMKEQE
ncbi:MAG: HlyC/CorC family transporter [Pontiellaceae bacterium]|nr:HlyC/CorC family transporter [Pontiellaceae bacterium]MBN2786361.1 HlyC/CorC family transporter [Pontiellaceae bacterium]